MTGRVEDGGEREGGSNSVVESQPSKLLVAGSIPVSRSSLRSLRELRLAGQGAGHHRAVGPARHSVRGAVGYATASRCSSVGRARPW